MTNFTVRFNAQTVLLDAGDILCPNGELENAQQVLSETVNAILTAGYLPLLPGWRSVKLRMGMPVVSAGSQESNP